MAGKDDEPIPGMIEGSTPHIENPVVREAGRSDPFSVPATARPEVTFEATPPPAPPAGSADTKDNWMAVVTLVFGILGGFVMMLIFWMLARNAHRRGSSNNYTLAKVGVGVALGWLGLLVVGVVLAVANDDGSSPVLTTEPDDSGAVDFGLDQWDCISKPTVDDPEAEYSTVRKLDQVSCDSPHWGQLVYVGTLPQTSMPTQDEMLGYIDDQCFAYTEPEYVTWPRYDAYVWETFPTRITWSQGDRGFMCFVVVDTEDLVGSVQAA